MKVFTLTAEQKTQVQANAALLTAAREAVKAAAESQTAYLASIAGDKIPSRIGYRISDDGNTLISGV